MTTPAQIAELRALMAKAVDPANRKAWLKDDFYDYIVVIRAMEALYEHGDALLATIDALTAERDRYRVTLETIREWKVPMVFDEKNERDVSLGVLYGSNGVRDYFRGVALTALTPPAEGGRA